MKKEHLKLRFIELRAMGNSYKKICSELNLSKPTAIKWGKELTEEISRQRKYLISKIFAQRITEREQGILIKLEQFKRTDKMNLPKKTRDKINGKVLKDLEKIFLKKISAIQLNMKNDEISSAIFIFDDDVKIETR
jgi:hypothetical protein